MERTQIEEVLSRVEARLEEDPEAGLSGSGFWKAVDSVKRSPDLVDEFADRIGRIDQKAFQRWAMLTVPIGVGTMFAELVTLGGLGLVGLAYYTSTPWNGFFLLAGMGVVLTATHGLAHLLVGRLGGIQFTHWFIGTLIRPQPGVKTDYATYLATSPSRRAWMHASGAIFSKIVPFALIPAGLIAGVQSWAIWMLVITGVASILTDLVWSTRFSDWKRFNRERRYITG
ncbi:MAG: hypothetical protein OXH95_04745 [bacterium]|nr:hypothetical protein [bacterium]MCY3652208.1 hypothetical protein [bacterium]MDE0643436.1 hypothetical protein [bacterium]MYD03563.1 hypothetical protein [Acidimicrobiia bacterium]